MNDAAAADKPSFFTRTGQRITKLRNFILKQPCFSDFAGIWFLVGQLRERQCARGKCIGHQSKGRISGTNRTSGELPRCSIHGGVVEETAIGDVLDAISYAADDDNIKLLLLNLDELSYASSAQSLRIGEALASFKESGKQVVAYADYFSQYQYHIASYSDALICIPRASRLPVMGQHPIFEML